MDLHKIDWENIPWEPVREGITQWRVRGEVLASRFRLIPLRFS